ncbi:MAG: hypothetical protein IJQ58_06975 [Synergistaceae bacterium]|nr:hypothetical protein [Synergistaceae bacterium]
MQMSLKDVLALAKTPEQREEMKQRLLAMMFRDKDDNEIDFSDIPPITDFSRFKPLKPRLDVMREHNRRLRLERERAEATKTE